jgi:hypothetical protein
MPLTRTKEQDAKRKREERAINPRAGGIPQLRPVEY